MLDVVESFRSRVRVVVGKSTNVNNTAVSIQSDTLVRI